jgi:hypothetical protein
MAEESEQPQQTTSSQTAPAPQSQQSRGPQQQGQRRNDRRDRGRGRHPGGQRYHARSDHPPQPAQEKPAGSTEKEADTDEEEEGEQNRSSTQRRHFRGGRAPKRVVEEWANDIYCE